MKWRLYAIATLFVAGCGGLASSNSGDAGTDRMSFHPDSATDGGTHQHDAAREARAHDAANLDAGVDVWSGACPGASGWSLFPLPFPPADGGATPGLSGVWGSAPNDVWAVEDYARGGFLLLHWDGSAWSASPLQDAGLGPIAGLSDGWGGGIWGSGTNDVWAVGIGGPSASALRSVALHWDGTAWSDLSPPGSAGYLFGVWGSGPSDVWAVGGWSSHGPEPVGGGEIVHWNGSAWSNEGICGFPGPCLFSGTLGWVWGTGPSDAWAVGPSSGGVYDAGVEVGNELLHWAGTSWSVVTAHGEAEFGSSTWELANAGWSSGPKDVWVIGNAYDHSGPSGTETLRWDGTSWAVSWSGTQYSLTGLWGSGPNDIWAAGAAIVYSDAMSSLGSGALLHWDGSTWCVVSLPTVDGGAISPISGISGSPSGIWAWSGTTLLHHP